ncbi:MAG: NFACT family protein [Candidatus Micrarchaeota archaeon]
MQSMGNWDYSAIARELNAYSGAFFDKFYICQDGSCLLKLRKKGTVNIVAYSDRLYVAENSPETKETPPQFAMIIRKWLENSNLSEVKQLNNDRVVSFEFKQRNGDNFSLVFELFAKGNALLLKDGKIVDLLKRESYASRSLKPKEQYVLPPAKKNLDRLTPSDFKPLGKTVAAISGVANIPPFYIEEALQRTKAPLEITELSEKQKQEVLKELKNISSECAPTVYLKDGIPTAFSFTKLKRFGEMEEKTFETFSQALEFYYASAPKVEKETEKEKGTRIATSKTANRLESQRKALEEFKKVEKENTEIAEELQNNYEFYEELLETAAQLTKEKKSEKEIEKQLASFIEKKETEKMNKIKEVKAKSGKVELELQN